MTATTPPGPPPSAAARQSRTQSVAVYRTALREDVRVLRSWSARRWTIATLSAIGAALVSGVPTGIIDTSFYSRPIPAPLWAYPLWALSAVIMGMWFAALSSGVGSPPLAPSETGGGQTVGGGLLSLIAIGCPTCNAAAVAALGTGGALSLFAPVQPLIGVVALAVLLLALHRRLQPPACLIGQVLSDH